MSQQFYDLHATNKRRDGPFNTLRVQEKETENMATKEMAKINAATQMKEDQRMAVQKRKKDELRSWMMSNQKNKQMFASNS